MLRTLTYFESIFNGIIIIIFYIGTWYVFLWIGLSKRKNFETSFSCFRPFGVWGVTYIACKLSHWLINVFFFFFMRKDHHLVYVIPFCWLRPSVCYSKIWTSTFVHKKRKKKSTGTLRCLSHASDPLGFGVWQLICWKLKTYYWKHYNKIIFKYK